MRSHFNKIGARNRNCTEFCFGSEMVQKLFAQFSIFPALSMILFRNNLGIPNLKYEFLKGWSGKLFIFDWNTFFLPFLWAKTMTFYVNRIVSISCRDEIITPISILCHWRLRNSLEFVIRKCFRFGLFNIIFGFCQAWNRGWN